MLQGLALPFLPWLANQYLPSWQSLSMLYAINSRRTAPAIAAVLSSLYAINSRRKVGQPSQPDLQLHGANCDRIQQTKLSESKATMWLCHKLVLVPYA